MAEALPSPIQSSAKQARTERNNTTAKQLLPWRQLRDAARVRQQYPVGLWHLGLDAGLARNIWDSRNVNRESEKIIGTAGPYHRCWPLPWPSMYS